MNATLEPVVVEINKPLRQTVQSVCQRIPPLWSLKNFVAVNPFLGLSDSHFLDAARLMKRVGHGDILMPAAFYREQIASGRIQEKDFHAAMRLVRETLPTEWAQEIDFSSFTSWQGALSSTEPATTMEQVLTFAEFLDDRTESSWATFAVEEISKWCSVYFDQGTSSWRMPWRHLGLFAAWKAAAQLDANPELMGLKRFRAFVAKLPDNPLELTELVLAHLGVPETLQRDFLHRQLMTLAGWSGYVQYLVRQRGLPAAEDDSLGQLLAVRLAYDFSLWQQFGGEPLSKANWEKQLNGVPRSREMLPPPFLARYVAQQALECGYQSELMAQLKDNAPGPTASEQRTLQAIFCIDVRSEVYRRALEAQSDDLETIGFAGFFGMAIEYCKFGQDMGGAHCPVLLTPKIKVRETLLGAAPNSESRLLQKLNFRQNVNGAWNSFKTSAISCFSFVETAGLWFGVKLAKDSLALASPELSFATIGRSKQFAPKIQPEVGATSNHGQDAETGISLGDQIAMAAGALKNMGLTSNFAKVVLICGHGSATTNNPYGSALDCGACGGHAGDANARVAAAILNQPAVREALERQGIRIPSETLFIAGLHNTTTDEIMIYDSDRMTAKREPELVKIKAWLAGASGLARRERAASLSLSNRSDTKLDQQISIRSRDWSQVRPEWGLAGNAAFIAAPRERTKGLNLGGRAFLHNYDASRDVDQSVLELIMVAPMVVASWINLQYYGSTVNNRLFGSGNKVLHNVVGTFGVWQGNGGDLQSGLPLQSVHDGTRWRHEPVRLNVFIEAAPKAIEKVIASQPAVRELVVNGWVNLFAMDLPGKRFWRWCGNQFVDEIA